MIPRLTHSNFIRRQKIFASITRPPFTIMAVFVQFLGFSIVIAAAIMMPWLALSIFEWAVLQGIIAATISYQLNMPPWWFAIHLFFTPALVATLALDLSPLWFLAAFMMSALVYGKTFQTQVPLYLSSQASTQALASLLPAQKEFSFIDLGCGYGGLLNHLSKIRPNGNFFGIEAAPLPYMLAKLQTKIATSHNTIRWGNFWKHSLSSYDIVYAYLSPVPMAKLWRKASREMKPGSILISNSFVIPGITPDKCIKINDLTNSTLYLWHINPDTKSTPVE